MQSQEEVGNMKNLKISNFLVGYLSLVTSITCLAPLAAAEERTSADLENSQQQLKNHMENDILSTILNEEIEGPKEEFGELVEDSEDIYEKEVEIENLESEAEGESGTGTVQNKQIDFEEENQQIQMSKLDGIVVDWGATPSGGEWVLYSDGLLTISGNFTPSFVTWGHQHLIL